MARSSISNSSSKLNLSRRKTAWLQNTIMTGNRMAEAIKHLEERFQPTDGVPALAVRWNELMIELVEMML